MVRAKFVCLFKGKHSYGATEVRFGAVYHNGDPNHENYKFWKASPQMELKMVIDNPEAADEFEVGREYYSDFTSAPAP